MKPLGRRSCPKRKFEENGEEIFIKGMMERKTQEENLHFMTGGYSPK
jgi:hypothetical protein